MPTDTIDNPGLSAGQAGGFDRGVYAQTNAEIPVAPVQLAQGAANIGSISSLTGQATITRASGEIVEAAVGTPVFQDDTFETAAGSGVGLSFNDGSSFSLGSDARLTIDSFVYDGGGGDSNMVMNLAQGAFSFVSGQVAKSGDNNMTIVTPTATIGIRGTAGAGDDDEVVLLQEPGQQIGELTVTTQGGTVSLTTPNAYTNTSNPFAAPTPPVQRPLGDIQSLFGGALRQLPVQLPANQNLPSGNEGDGATGEDGEGGEGEGEGDAETAEGEGETAEGEGETADGEGDGEGDGTEGDGTEGEGEGAEGEGAEEEGEGTDGEGAEGEGDGPEGDTAQLGTNQTQGDTPPPPPTAPPPPSTAVAPPPPKPPVVQKPPPAPAPPPPDPVVDSGDGGAVADPANVIPVNSSVTVTLTDGADRIEVSGAELTVTVNGTLQGGDSIVDVSGSSAQVVSIVDVTSHSFTVNGIENVLFGNMTGSETHTITVAGTGTVIFNSNSGPFNANISGDGANNTFNVGVGISANSFVSANMGGGVDTVNINTGVQVNLILGQVEFVGSTIAGTQNVVLGNAVSGVSFDFGNLGDADTLTLFNGTNSLIVSDIQTVNGGTGNDTIIVGSTVLQTLSLGGGTDSVIASSVASFNVTALANVENFVGSAGVDNVGLATSLTAGSVYDGGGGGNDTLTLFSGSSNAANISNFRNIMGTASDEFLSLQNAMAASFNTIVDLGGGSFDELSLESTGGNTVSVANTETITGSGGADTLILRDLNAEDIDLGAGSDTVQLDGGAGTYTFFVFDGIETVTGANGITETIDLTNIGIGLSGTLFNLGVLNDGDAVQLGNQGNAVSITTLGSISSGTGNDTVTLAATSAGSIDLGGGTDTVNASGVTSATIASLSNVELYNGSAGADALTLSTLLVSGNDFNGQADGDGDILNLSAGVNQAIIDHFEAINGTSSNDQLTLENQIFAGFGTVVDLQGGLDSLALGNFDNVLTASNVEFLNAGTGNDSIFMGTAMLSGAQIDGGIGGTDTLTLLSGSSNTGTISNWELVAGGVGTTETLLLEAILTTTNTVFDFGDFTDNDALSMADGGNTIAVRDLKNFTGGGGDDIVTTLSALLSGSTYDGGGSGDDSDNLILLDGVTHSGIITDFETISGNTISGIDLFFEAGSQVNTSFNFTGGGTNVIHINDTGSFATLNGVEAVFGGLGGDFITVNDTTGVDFHLGDGGDNATGAVGVTDVFFYEAQSDANIGEGETITNFEIGVDVIDVSVLAGGNFAFIGGAAFTNGSGNLEGRFADANTVEFDVDDDGVADMEITLSNGVAGSLTSADFADEVLQV